MTGSLLSVTACRLFAEFCDLFLRVVDSFARDLRGIPYASEMATGSGQPPLDRSGVDYRVKLDIPWNAPETVVNLQSQRIYELDTASVPDVLGLHVRRRGAAVIRVLTGRNSRSVRALVPDDNVLVPDDNVLTVVDMDHVNGLNFPVADLDILRGMWPFPVVSSMTDKQMDLELIRHTCKQTLPWEADMCRFCGKVIKLDDKLPTIIWTARCLGAPSGKGHPRIVWIIYVRHMLCHLQ